MNEKPFYLNVYVLRLQKDNKIAGLAYNFNWKDIIIIILWLYLDYCMSDLLHIYESAHK